MRRSIVCASAVVVLGLVLLGALGSGGRPMVEAAVPPIGTTPFYAALDCDLVAPGIQDNCSLTAAIPNVDMGVIVYNNSSSPYTMSRVQMSASWLRAGADFNHHDLPGAWACLSFSGFLICQDNNGIGNAIPAYSSVTVAVVHYSFNPGIQSPALAVPLQFEFSASGPASTNVQSCGQYPSDDCPTYYVVINLPATDLKVVLDCDVAAPGIQDNCTLAPGAPAVDVGVVLVNNTAAAIQLAAFNFNVEDPDPGRLNPPEIVGPFPDRNPDLNQGQLSSTVVCPSVGADTHLGAPGTVESFLSCYDAVGGTTVASGAQLELATVHYVVPPTASPGSVTLALFMAAAANTDALAIFGCDFTCPAATVAIVSAPVNLPTPTEIASPSATPTPSATPVVISEPPASTPTADVYVAIDCDLTRARVQSDCTYRLGDASEIDVGVVLVNNGPQPPRPLAAFEFTLHMPDRGRLAPLPSLSLLDGNPDFNDTGVTGDWLCDRAVSDLGTDGPAAAASDLACVEPADPGNGPRPATGSELLLGTVRYSVAAGARPGTVPLGVDNVSATDTLGIAFGICDPFSIVPQPCLLPATLRLVAYPAVTKVPAGVGSNVNPAVPAANLWICQVGLCGGPGEGDLEVVEHATGVITGDQNGDSLPDGLGAYEFQVEFDPLAIQSVNPTDVVFSPGGAGAARGPANCAMSIASENLVRFGCVTSGQVQGPEGSFDLAKLDLIPAADDAKDLFPGNDNGINTVVKDNQCELADVFGHPVQGTVGDAGLLPACDDLSVTIRILEGDLNLDCKVDVADEALIAGHYGATFGSAFYDRWFDVEPRFHDLDVDIKDLQKVFGRDGSICQQPIPVQAPVVPPFSLAG